jgi:hypothetical protein
LKLLHLFDVFVLKDFQIQVRQPTLHIAECSSLIWSFLDLLKVSAEGINLRLEQRVLPQSKEQRNNIAQQPV